MLYANLMAVCFIEPELLLIEVLHCGNRDFRPFVTLTLTLCSYTNLARISWRYTGRTKMNFLRQCVLQLANVASIVTRGHIGSRVKDGRSCHSICYSHKPHLRGSLFYRTEVIADRSFTLREYGFSTFFCSCDLDLDPMTFIHEPDPYSIPHVRI